MDSSAAVLKAVIVRLNAIPEITAVISDRIYTDVPQKATFPYVQLTISAQPFAANDFSGQEHMLRIQAFSQKSSAKEAMTIRKLCLDALDRQEANIALTEGALTICQFSSSDQPFQEDDGKTWQAVGELEMTVV